MTRFIAPTLAGLGTPPAVETLDYEAILTARLAELRSRFIVAGLAEVAAVLDLETEPLTIGQEADAYLEVLVRQRINEAVRANLVATSRGRDLDHVVATFYGVARLPLVADPRDFDLFPEDWEDDDTFRARAILSLEARSTAGPEGSYVYHALETDPAAVLDAVCYGEEDGATYIGGAEVLAPEVLVVVLAREGTGEPSDALLGRVRAQLNAEEIRPIGDKLVVEPAAIVPYAVDVLLRIAPGLSQDPIKAAARTAIRSYANERRAIGLIVQPVGIAAAAKVPGVRELVVLTPSADLDPGSKGAGFCTGITITAETAADSWRP